MEREELGRVVRTAWVRWLTCWDELDAAQREVDMRIGEAVAAHVIDSERSSIVAAFVTMQQEMIDRQRAELASLRAALAAWEAYVKGGGD